MPILNWKIKDLFTNIDVNFRCILEALPEGATLSVGYLMFKLRATQPDDEAPISKRITPIGQLDIGQIIQPGPTVPAEAIFLVNPSDWAALRPGQRYVGEIKFITTDGENLLFARATNVVVEQGIVHTTT